MAQRTLTQPQALSHYVTRMTPGQAICRARCRHAWPSDIIQPGQPVPSGIIALRQHDGSYQVDEYCLDCGTECTWTTLPKGYYDKDVIRRYKYPEDWVRVPREVEFTPRDIRAERMLSIRDMLFTARGKAKS